MRHRLGIDTWRPGLRDQETDALESSFVGKNAAVLHRIQQVPHQIMCKDLHVQ